MRRAAVLIILAVLVTASSTAVALSFTTASPKPFTAYSLSAYEWLDTSWSKGAASYEPDLLLLKKLGVTDLFVDITRAVTYKQERSDRLVPYLTTFRMLVTDAAKKGIRVHALMGDLEWATSDQAGLSEVIAIMSEMRTIVAGTMPAGLQLDVEPWGLPDWGTHEPAYALEYNEMVRRVVAAWRAGELTGALGFAVPFWWSGVGGSVPDIHVGNGSVTPLTAVLDSLAPVPTAYLNVMAYSSRPSEPGGTVTMFQSDIATARSIGSRVTLLLGQDLAPDPDGAGSTFAGSTWHAWRANLATLRSRFASTPQFGGVAVEDTQALILLSKN